MSLDNNIKLGDPVSFAGRLYDAFLVLPEGSRPSPDEGCQVELLTQCVNLNIGQYLAKLKTDQPIGSGMIVIDDKGSSVGSTRIVSHIDDSSEAYSAEASRLWGKVKGGIEEVYKAYRLEARKPIAAHLIPSPDKASERDKTLKAPPTPKDQMGRSYLTRLGEASPSPQKSAFEDHVEGDSHQVQSSGDDSFLDSSELVPPESPSVTDSQKAPFLKDVPDSDGEDDYEELPGTPRKEKTALALTKKDKWWEASFWSDSVYDLWQFDKDSYNPYKLESWKQLGTGFIDSMIRLKHIEDFDWNILIHENDSNPILHVCIWFFKILLWAKFIVLQPTYMLAKALIRFSLRLVFMTVLLVVYIPWLIGHCCKKNDAKDADSLQKKNKPIPLSPPSPVSPSKRADEDQTPQSSSELSPTQREKESDDQDTDESDAEKPVSDKIPHAQQEDILGLYLLDRDKPIEDLTLTEMGSVLGRSAEKLKAQSDQVEVRGKIGEEPGIDAEFASLFDFNGEIQRLDQVSSALDEARPAVQKELELEAARRLYVDPFSPRPIAEQVPAAPSPLADLNPLKRGTTAETTLARW